MKLFFHIFLFFQSNPCQHPIVILRDVSPDDLQSLLAFMYNGEVRIEEDRLKNFLRTAEMLQVQGLADGGQASNPGPEEEKQAAEVVASTAAAEGRRSRASAASPEVAQKDQRPASLRRALGEEEDRVSQSPYSLPIRPRSKGEQSLPS